MQQFITEINQCEALEFETLRQAALNLWRESRHGDARILLEDCLRRGEGITSERIVALSNTLSVVEWSEGNYDKALRILFVVEPLLEFASLGLRGRVFNNRAIARRLLNQLTLALEDYKAALENHRKAGALRAAYEVENNIAELCVFMGRPADAFPYLDDLQAECDDNLILAQAEDTRALALLAQANYSEAYEASLHSLILLKQFPDEEKPLENSLRTMGEIAIRFTLHPTAPQVRNALETAGKSISRAAQLLEMDHSSLTHLIRKKYPELEKWRKDPLQPRGLSVSKTQQK